MRSTLYPALAGVVMIAVVTMVGLGMLAPVRAQANDTGKVLLGVAAGALLFGLLDRDSDRRCDDYAYRTTDPRCYEYRGHWYWREGVDRRPEDIYGHQSYIPDRDRNDRWTSQWDGRQGYNQQWRGQQTVGHGGQGDQGRGRY